LESRASGAAVDADLAAVLLDDARGDRQAETGPLALRLGREERLEDARGHLRLDPGPGILNRHLHVTIFHPGLDQDLAPPVHGLYRVVDEVGPHLVEFADVR